MALHALSKMAALLFSSGLNMTVVVKYRPYRFAQTYNINEDNALVLQTMDVRLKQLNVLSRIYFYSVLVGKIVTNLSSYIRNI